MALHRRRVYGVHSFSSQKIGNDFTISSRGICDPVLKSGTRGPHSARSISPCRSIASPWLRGPVPVVPGRRDPKVSAFQQERQKRFGK